MSVSELHPEELLDKDARGTLSDAERTLLDAHLARCGTCRFERTSRLDFAAEREELESDDAPFTSELIALALQSGATPAPKRESAPEIDPPPADDAPAPEPAVLPVRRRRPRAAWLLVAAALMAASAAAAGPGGGARWLLGAVGVDAEVSDRAPDAEVASAPGTRGARVVSPSVAAPIAPAAASVEAPSPAPVEPDVASAPEVTPSVAAPPAALAPTSPARVTAPPVAAPHAAVPVVAPAAAPVVAPAAPSSAPVAPAPVTAAAPEPVGASALFDEAVAARRAGRYARAIELFRRLQAEHATSREAHVSHATLGRLLLDRGDLAGALASFDAYRRHGHGPLDESVIIGRATALERLGREGEARRAWGELLTEFPRSPFAEHARRQTEVQR